MSNALSCFECDMMHDHNVIYFTNYYHDYITMMMPNYEMWRFRSSD